MGQYRPPPRGIEQMPEGELYPWYVGFENHQAKSAHEELHRRYQGPFGARALRMCGQDHEAADRAVQDHRIRTWLKRSRFNIEYRWYPWSDRILTSETYNVLREKAKLDKQLSDEVGAEIPARSDEHCEGASDNEQQRIFQECLETLEEMERNCLLLRSAGVPYAEIAKQMGIPQGTVATTVARAKKKMIQCVQRKLNEGGKR